MQPRISAFDLLNCHAVAVRPCFFVIAGTAPSGLRRWGDAGRPCGEWRIYQHDHGNARGADWRECCRQRVSMAANNRRRRCLRHAGKSNAQHVVPDLQPRGCSTFDKRFGVQLHQAGRHVGGRATNVSRRTRPTLLLLLLLLQPTLARSVRRLTRAFHFYDGARVARRPAWIRSGCEDCKPS